MGWDKRRYARDPEYRKTRLADDSAYRRRRWAKDPRYRAKLAARRFKTRRENQLKLRYGISLDEYNAILARQGGVCAICKKKSNRSLCVDHCHKRKKVRGLLCRKCNSELGLFDDDPNLLRAALAYLEAFDRDK